MAYSKPRRGTHIIYISDGIPPQESKARGIRTRVFCCAIHCRGPFTIFKKYSPPVKVSLQPAPFNLKLYM